jgi:hypothetical protein
MVTTSPLVEELVTGFADLADAVTSEISRLTAERDHAQSQLVDARALIEALLDRLSHPPTVSAASPIPVPVLLKRRVIRIYGAKVECRTCHQDFVTEPHHITVCAPCHTAARRATVARAQATHWRTA